MKRYKDIITLVKNNRGCYILDTVKGCSVCSKDKPHGCYNDCYAKNIARRYGFDFGNPNIRNFEKDDQIPLFDFCNSKHISKIIREISLMKMPFVRIGEMGDPSENWEHTFKVCNIIKEAGKSIVIITKHWKEIPTKMLESIWDMDLYINTSISALDNNIELEYRLKQFNRLKDYCNSILRIVSCDFNNNLDEGKERSYIQDKLFSNSTIIDTVFRPSCNNPFVTSGLINVEKASFLKSKMLVSRFNKNAYLGRCENCPDMCGLNL